MKNVHASEGMAEDMIRAIVQYGAAENHIKTMIEKTEAELKFIDPSKEQEIIGKSLGKINELKELLADVTNVRRDMMLQLFEKFDGDKDYWCLVKHLGVGAYEAFESYMASNKEDWKLYENFIKANSAFVRAMSGFLGTEITDCAACFSDMLKGDITNED